MRRVAIIENGGANTASLVNALARLDCRASLTADAAAIREATHVILPGVGAAGDAMQRLRASGLDEVIPSLTQPLLGICLGMQLLYAHSAEGDVSCLGVIPGAAQRFTRAPGRPVPHMGWNTLHPCQSSPLLRGIAGGEYAYFVHSYALPVSAHTIATSDYGGPFSAAVARGNFHGVQFHPERSGVTGAALLKNFLELRCC